MYNSPRKIEEVLKKRGKGLDKKALVCYKSVVNLCNWNANNSKIFAVRLQMDVEHIKRIVRDQEEEIRDKFKKEKIISRECEGQNLLKSNLLVIVGNAGSGFKIQNRIRLS